MFQLGGTTHERYSAYRLYPDFQAAVGPSWHRPDP